MHLRLQCGIVIGAATGAATRARRSRAQTLPPRHLQCNPTAFNSLDRPWRRCGTCRALRGAWPALTLLQTAFTAPGKRRSGHLDPTKTTRADVRCRGGSSGAPPPPPLHRRHVFLTIGAFAANWRQDLGASWCRVGIWRCSAPAQTWRELAPNRSHDGCLCAGTTASVWPPLPLTTADLWTDAFGVCNFITLAAETGEHRYLAQAEALIGGRWPPPSRRRKARRARRPPLNAARATTLAPYPCARSCA